MELACTADIDTAAAEIAAAAGTAAVETAAEAGTAAVETAAAAETAIDTIVDMELGRPLNLHRKRNRTDDYQAHSFCNLDKSSYTLFVFIIT